MHRSLIVTRPLVVLFAASAAIVAGCAGNAAPPAPGPPVVDLSIPPPPPVASPPEAVASSAPTVAQPPPPPVELTMEQRYAAVHMACKGASVDLRRALYTPECKLQGVKPPSLKDPVSALGLTLEANPAKVKPGGRTEVVARVRNPASEPVVVEFETECSAGPLFEVTAFDRKGRRADDDEVVTGLLCVPRIVRVGLEPGGVAEARVVFEARKYAGRSDPLFALQPQLFARGTYELRLTLPLWMETGVRAPVITTSLQVGP